MSKPKFFITDVFTSQKYGGNQLATFIDCESLSDQEMQKIAKEINFSETTFITSRQPKEGSYDVRIFTPSTEVQFAGHPTLGTAYIIRQKLRLTTTSEVTLNLRVGRIPVTFTEISSQPIQLRMKQISPIFGGRAEMNTLAHVLGITASDIDPNFPIEEVSTGFPTLIVPLVSLAALKRIQVNKEAYFALINTAWAKIILAFSRPGYQENQNLGVRVFADYYGISEDAATGSSNGSLAAYLAHYKLFGNSNIDAQVGQGYEIGRPSTLVLHTELSNSEIQVFVGGSVIEVAEGVWG